jgi:hypothetical protein
VYEDDELTARRLEDSLRLEGHVLERAAELVEGLLLCAGAAENASRVDDRRRLMQLEIRGEVVRRDLAGSGELLEACSKAFDAIAGHQPGTEVLIDSA